jgi:hypothetical protein
MRGPGKYDELATFIREHVGAQAVLIAVIGGDRGDGMSFQGPPALTARVPQLLRRIASDIQNGVEDEPTNKGPENDDDKNQADARPVAD